MKLYYFFVLLVVVTVQADDTCGATPVSEWGDVPSYRKEILSHPLKLVIIQHTASAECNTDRQCQNIVRGIRDYHRFERGFVDIGPSFLIGGNGKVYEGAGWNRVGAHTKLYNNRSIGISFIGNFEKKLPNAKAIEAAFNLISCGVQNEYLSEDYQLVGHGQVTATKSPGSTLKSEIREWPHWVQNVHYL